MKTNYLLIICMVFALGMAACSSQNSEEEALASVLEGDWNVQWITAPEDGASMEGMNLTMNGKMSIESDNKITIEAYGYEGCIFGSDTLIHTLNWEISGDTLNLKNSNDEFGIPYVIKEANDQKVKLQLLDDVYLFLSK